MSEVFIVAAARTPIGNFNGTFASLKASDLGAVAIKEVLRRAQVKPADVNEVIFGQALGAGAGQNPGRQASLKAGLPLEVPAYVLNMLCGSSLKSVWLGYQSIRAGENTVVVCGGQESMSSAPHTIHLRAGTKFGHSTLKDSVVHDGLTDAGHNIVMGITAENCATRFNITREQQDAQAFRSQQLAEHAQKNGYFNDEIVSVSVPSGRHDTADVILDKDEYPKHGTTIEALSRLQPCFLFDGTGTVTAGNACGMNDSAAAVLLMSANEVRERAVKPLARIVGFAQSGMDPTIMGMGPVTAVEKLLKKVGWSKNDVDLYELNEAYASVALSVNKELGIDANKVNVNGGAIALGHPLGASGSRVLVTLIYALIRTGGTKGVASLCIGGGMGIAIAIELV